MPHGITQCYLTPGRGDIPALTPADAGTRLSDPGGMQGRVDLVGLLHTDIVYLPIQVLTGLSQYQKPGPTCVNFVYVMNTANHYATRVRFSAWSVLGRVPMPPGKSWNCVL